MEEKILVLGARGNVGAEVVRALTAKGAAVRAGDRYPEKVRELFGGSIDPVYFDFSDPSSFDAAFRGITRMFLVRPPQMADMKRDMFPALDAAKAAGVLHVTFLSLIGIESNRIVPHYKVEQYFRGSGQTWSFLRCSFFMQNLDTTHRDEIRDADEIFIPAGLAGTSFIDVRDIAAVAALTLTEHGHENKVYELTGGEALDYYQVAELFTQILGRRITYRNPRAFTYFLRQLRRGKPVMFALVSTWLYTNTKNGMADRVTGEVRRLLGRDPIPMSTWIDDSREHWAR